MKVHVHRAARRRRLRAPPADPAAGAPRTRRRRAFLGLDDGDPDPFYAQLDKLGVPYARLASATRHRPCARSSAARVHADASRHRAHPSRPRGCLRRRHGVARAPIVSTKHNDDPSGSARSATSSGCRAADGADHRITVRSPTSTSSGSACRPERSVCPLRARRAAGGLGAPGVPSCPPTSGSCSRFAPRAPERARRRDRGARTIRTPPPGGAPRARGRQPRAGAARSRRRRGVADAVYLPGRVGDVRRLAPRGELSSTRRAGRVSAWRCSRRCWRGSRSSRAASSSIPEIVVDGTTGAATAFVAVPAIAAGPLLELVAPIFTWVSLAPGP